MKIIIGYINWVQFSGLCILQFTLFLHNSEQITLYQFSAFCVIPIILLENSADKFFKLAVADFCILHFTIAQPRVVGWKSTCPQTR